MAIIGGPQDPKHPRTEARVIPFPVRKRLEDGGTEPTSPADPSARSPADRSEPLAPAAPSALGPVGARMLGQAHAMLPQGTGGLGARLPPIKSAGTNIGRIKDTPEGKVFDGSVTIQNAEAAARLAGVTRVTGDLTLQESALRSADLEGLRALSEVGGRLTIEGNAALTSLDALGNLERARGLYIGFNPRLAKVHLPKLAELDAALIVEHNPALTDIALPAFTAAGRYLHVHENLALTGASMPRLESLEGELSFLDNPRLAAVQVATPEAPAQVKAIECSGNARSSFDQLFAAPALR